MSYRGSAIAAGLAVLLVAVGASAENLSPAALAERFPGVAPEDVSESPLPGVYEVAIGANIAYVSKNGRYLLRGSLIDLDNDSNLTEQRQDSMRAVLLSGAADGRSVEFAPESPDHWVTVFTDIDCGYCQRMHAEIERINELGIGVRYLFYPRSGPATDSWSKADAVWCAQNRQQAMTRAKAGQEVASRDCPDTPVASHYELGQDVGIRGTPAVITAEGRIVGGYLPPEALLARLRAGR